ncbi:helix-turn-helix domain-containing protein [Lapidilactobacillus mulanensis]|uniref:Helix-turn-helix domain-containing protein n=1 Tax=Lapidilactobacillus mulanensis TaxID=2485999 RepID=A0ABW4DMY3_9LACO|nr:AraC family transcriptional regulator [Lapidilactobacillus mulanensis]
MRVVFTRMNTQLPLYLESIGSDWNQEVVFRPNGYPYYHWLQTTSGQGIITINKQKLLLPVNTGILLAPNVSHQYHSLNDQIWKTQYLTFDGSEVANLLTNKGLNYQVFNNLTADFILKQSTTITPATEPITLSVLVYRFLLLLDQHASKSEWLNSRNVSTLLKIRQYLENHYAETITNEELATLAGFSTQHLIRQFKTAYQVTPLQYLNDLRLRNAQALLISQPQLNIDEIALRTGYSSSSYFIAQFRKVKHVTPKQFRQLH